MVLLYNSTRTITELLFITIVKEVSNKITQEIQTFMENI